MIDCLILTLLAIAVAAHFLVLYSDRKCKKPHSQFDLEKHRHERHEEGEQ